ncbi:unnamed protein product [Closterium sp. Yama58-4]|nr:unnamed protein product [Closterium sp. Yama58-4]
MPLTLTPMHVERQMAVDDSEGLHKGDGEGDSFRSQAHLLLTRVDSPAKAGNKLMPDSTEGSDEAGPFRSMDGADEVGTSMDCSDEVEALGRMDGADEVEGGLVKAVAVGESIIEGGDGRIEEETEQQQGGGFRVAESDSIQEQMSEASSSASQGNSLEEYRVVNVEEVPGQGKSSEMPQNAVEMDEGPEQGSSFHVATGAQDEGAANKEDEVHEQDGVFLADAGENDKLANEEVTLNEAASKEDDLPEKPSVLPFDLLDSVDFLDPVSAFTKTSGEDVSNEAVNKEDGPPEKPSVLLPDDLLDSLDFLDPISAFTKTLRMLHHFLSSQPTAESLPTFFLGLPRDHYFRADQGNSSLCLPDDATCKENGQCSGFLRPREWLEEGGEEQAHQQRWQRLLACFEARLYMGRSRGAGEEDHAPSGGSRPKRRRYATTSWQDAVGGGSSGGGGVGGEGAGAAAGGGGGPGGGGGTGGGGRKGVFHCNYCHRDVTGEVRVKCAACVDFDLCAECFSVGAAVHPHSASHPYHVMDTMSFPLVHEDWTADEEMLLLEALEMYGMGNWGEIAEHVGSKSKTQCHDHYLYDYLLSPCGPLPDLSRLRTQADTEAAKAAMEEQEAAETAARAQEAVLYNVPVVKSEPGTKTDDAAAPITSGYNAKRNEFDPEYDNEAEAPLAELEFKESDSSVDRQLKIKMLHIYYSRLEERSRRKAFILERGLLDPRRVDGTIRPDTNSSSRERVRDRDRDRERGGTDEQHKREDGAEQGGEREGGTLGEMGAEAGEGGVEKGEGGGKRGGKRGGGGERRRSKEEREMFLRCRVFARFLSAEEHEGLVQSLTQAEKLRDRVAVLQELRAAGCKSLAEGRRFIQAHYKDNPAAAAAAIACLPPSATAISTASPGGASAALDISAHPGCDLLSAKERELCMHMRLLPAHYLRAKQVILQQATLSGGAISRAAVHRLFRLPPATTDAIFRLLLGAGWIAEAGGNIAGGGMGGGMVKQEGM